MTYISPNVFRSAFVRDLFPETFYAGGKAQKTTTDCAKIKVSIQRVYSIVSNSRIWHWEWATKP